MNYELAKREAPKVRAALTRAEKKGYKAVLAACYMAIAHWSSWGAWPDDWHRWNIALGDAATKHEYATGERARFRCLDDLSAG